MPDANKQAGYFGLKNVKYAMPVGDTWATPVSLPYAQSLALSTKLSDAALYADDRKVIEVTSDIGYDGTFGFSTLDREYEIALGYSIEMENGALAQLDQAEKLKHCIYFETTGAREDNSTFAIKVWLFNVATAKSGKNYTTKGENPEFGAHEIPITVNGAPLLDNGGDVYVDPVSGQERTVFYLTCSPGAPGYANFGDNVPALHLPE